MKKRVLLGMAALLLSVSLLMNHQGKRDESSFVIGTLTTTKGKFRVNCFLKKVQTQCLIHQIRIDKINE